MTTRTKGLTTKPRLDSIQLMRGAAAMLVVVAHAIDVVVYNDATLGPSILVFNDALDNLGAMGVDLFFIISGFVMALSTRHLGGARDALDFLVRRWIRIGPPFLIACGTFAVLRLPNLDPWRAWMNAVVYVPIFDGDRYTMPPLSVGWTLSFEFTFYLFVAAAVFAVARKTSRRMILLLGVLILLAGVGTLARPTSFAGAWTFNAIYFEFALGVLAYLLWQGGRAPTSVRVRTSLALLALGTLLAGVFVGYGQIYDPSEIANGSQSFARFAWWGTPMALLFLALLPPVRVRFPALRAALLKLGDASYSIYLVHYIVFFAASRVIARLPLHVDFLADISILTLCAGAAAAGVLFHRWIERPVTRQLDSRWKERDPFRRSRSVP